MTISAAHWRGRRLPGAGAADSSVEPRGARAELIGSPARRQRRHAHAEQAGTAASVNDRFLDVIVLLSVVMFLALVVGVGMLVLQSSGR